MPKWVTRTENVKRSFFFSATAVSVVRSDADSTTKLRRLTEVQSDLVNDYAGDIRTEINAMAELLSVICVNCFRFCSVRVIMTRTS